MRSKRRDTWQLDNAPVLRRKIAADLDQWFTTIFGCGPFEMPEQKMQRLWAGKHADGAHNSFDPGIVGVTLGLTSLRPVARMPLLWVGEEMCTLATDTLSDPDTPMPVMDDMLDVLSDPDFAGGLAMFRRPLAPTVMPEPGMEIDENGNLYAIAWDVLNTPDGRCLTVLGIGLSAEGRYSPIAWAYSLLTPTAPQSSWVNSWAALLLLMSTPTIAEPRRIDVRTGGAPKAGSERPDLMVTSIQLRPLRTVDHDRETDSQGRVYTCRWLVRPHLRRLPDGRVVPIPGHIKGPSWAPLKAREPVKVWRR